MKKILSIVFIIFIFSTLFSEVKKIRISNNLELLYYYAPENDFSAMSIFIDGGSFNYDKSKSGIEKLIFRMIENGGKNYNLSKMNELKDKYFISISYENSYDYSSFSFMTVNRYFEDVVKIFADNFKNPDFSETLLEKEKIKMIDEIKSKKDDPDEFLFLKINDYFFNGHPYSSDPDGYEESVMNLKPDDLYDHLNMILSKRRIIMSVVSGLPFEQTEKIIKQYFGFINGKEEKKRILKGFQLSEKDTIIKYSKDGLQTKYLACKFTIPSVNDEDYIPVRIGLSILSKRVYETLRTKHGLTYSAYVGASNKLSNYGVFYVSTDYPDSALKLFKLELDNFKNSGIKQEEIDDMKNIFQTSFYLEKENTMKRAYSLAYNYLIFNDYNYDLKFIKKIEKLKSQQIDKVLNRYLKNFKFVLLE